MRRIILCLALLIGASGMGCIKAPLEPPEGFAFNDTIVPLDLDFDNTQIFSKRGEASTVCFFGLFASGNAGTFEAARNGGLTTIEYADYRYFNIMGIYQKYTTIVYGE